MVGRTRTTIEQWRKTRAGLVGILAAITILAACGPITPRPSPLVPSPLGSRPHAPVPTTRPPAKRPPTTLPPAPPASGPSCSANSSTISSAGSIGAPNGTGSGQEPTGSDPLQPGAMTPAEAYDASLELADGNDSVTVAATAPDGDFVLETVDAADSPGLVVLLAVSGHEITAISTPGTVRATGTSELATVARSRVGSRTAVTSAARGGLGSGDPFRAKQWSMNGADFDQLWGDTNSGSGIKVAVVDTGVDITNPDLGNNVTPGIDLIAGSSEPNADGTTDPNGHGTHVAGIIAAEHDNGIGIVGVAPSATIMPIRVLDDRGIGSSHDVAHGIDWAVDNGADVINLSLSGGHDPVMSEAIGHAAAEGVVIIAAAGNTSAWIDNDSLCDVDAYPAAYGEVIAVGSLNSSNDVSSFSLRRGYVDIAAPGENIVSTWPTALTPRGAEPYAYDSGTSMAAPYVSGIVALMKSYRPDASVGSLRSALLSSAVPTSSMTSRDPGRGCGRADPIGAVASTAGGGTANGIAGCGIESGR